ncbi:MAG: cell division protein ZipA [Gammaproteobacteria bacterium]
MESSFSLRLGLVLIGALVIAAIYFLSTRKSRNRRRFRNQGKLGRINPVDAITAQQSASEKSAIFSADDNIDAPLAETFEAAVGQVAPDVRDDIDDLPKVEKNPSRRQRKSSRKRKKSVTQMEMSFDDETGADVDTADAEETDRLLTLYVLPSTEQGFMGETVIQALNSVGLKYGEMEIFNHFGAGRLQTNQALFSVANMVEPGTFDLNQIERFQTPGLVFFLQLPAPLDGAVSFELFLNTAQRLTEALGGELYATPKTPLDSTLIDEMRRVAAEY